LTSHSTHLRLSCPYTSPQNGKAERAMTGCTFGRRPRCG
jgi:hypothetical protein